MDSELRDVLHSLGSPWEKKCVGLFEGICNGPVLMWDDLTILAGECSKVEIDVLEVQFAHFQYGSGFNFNVGQKGTIRIPDIHQRALPFGDGDRIICCGKMRCLEGQTWIGDRQTVAIPFPSFNHEAHWNAVHLFSGAFDGWTQAFNRLPRVFGDFLIGSQVHLDADLEVAQAWVKKHGIPYSATPLMPRPTFDFSPHRFIHGDVKDISFLHLAGFGGNTIYTASPPCVSWSRGGKKQGLASVFGQDFLHAIMTCGVAQPNMIAFECAAEIPASPHFRVIKALLEALGFRCLWNDVCPLHAITHTARTRWLGVWIRGDLFVQSIVPPVIPTPSFFDEWRDQIYCFSLPRSVREQLTLSPSERSIYGDRCLLPKAKRSSTPVDATVDQVLNLRVPPLGQPLPTLCASYSSQHLLGASHLRERGIFASLECTNGSHAFFDPFRYMALFGVVEPVVVSAKLSLAFKQIGNAVAVPHSVMTLVSGVAALLGRQIDVQDAVLKVWLQRITSYTGFIVSDSRFHVLCSAPQAVAEVVLQLPTLGDGLAVVELRILHAVTAASHDLLVPLQWTVERLFSLFKWKYDITSHLFLWHTDERVHNTHGLVHVIGLSSQWYLYLSNRLLATLTFGRSLTHQSLFDPKDAKQDTIEVVDSSVDISPTVPYVPQADGCATCQVGSFDGIVHSPAFLRAVSCAEACMSRNKPTLPGFHVLQNPPTGFTMPVGLHELSHTIPGLKRRRIMIDQTECVIVRDQDRARSPSEIILVAKLGIEPVTFVKVLNSAQPSSLFTVDDRLFRLQKINGREESGTGLQLVHGDFVEFSFVGSATIHAGGHHSAQPVALPAGADFGSRCEFAINTSGWLATDEMQFLIENIQRSNPAFAFFGPIVRWDLNLLDFDDSSFQEIIIPNHRLTILPILCGPHWAAVEVLKAGARTTVQIVGFPGPIVQNVVLAIARVMDFNPAHLIVHQVNLPVREHFCGWQLLHRWFAQANLQEDVPIPNDSYAQTSLVKRRLIDEVLVAAIDDWHNASIPVAEWTFAAKLRRSFMAHLATRFEPTQPVTAKRLFVSFTDSDVPAPPRTQAALVHHDIIPDLAILRRLFHLRERPAWLHSDECDAALDCFRPWYVHTYFAPPSEWISDEDCFRFFDGRQPDTWFHQHVVWPIIIGTTWVLVELVRDPALPVSLFVSAPHSLQRHVPDIAGHVARLHSIEYASIQQIFIPFNTAQHMCGWSLLESLFVRHQCALPDSSFAASHIFAASRHHELVQEIQRNGTHAWLNAGVPESTSDLAYDIRTLFLLRVLEGRIPESYSCAGGPSDTAMPQAPASPKATVTTSSAPNSTGKPDPWLEADPWTRKGKKPLSTKWEDLILPEQHPIVDDKGGLLTQTHKLQASSRKSGAILTTRAAIADMMRLTFEGPTTLILPASEKLTVSEVAKKLIGPHELVLHDPALKCEYKRLVVLLPLLGTIRYTLPTPKITLHATAAVELVIEVDSRLLTQVEHDTVKPDPMRYIREALLQLHPTLKEELTLYAFRVGHHPTASRSEPQYQCILKAPKKHRHALLQSSGLLPLLIRDFFDQSSQPVDVSVVPRFWNTTPRDVNEARIVLKDVKGFAGMVVTKRGLATRAWDDQIASVRNAVLPNDTRLVKENLDIVPRHQYSSTGWPPAIEPRCVVQSTVQAVGLAPVPSKAFRTNGVFGWVLGFGARPSVLRFTLDINGATYEILLVEEERISGPKGQSKGQKWKKDKNSAEGKSITSTPATGQSPGHFVASPLPSGESQRISALEQRFDKLENRQSRMEEKMDTRFTDISNSLRQLLQASSAHQRERSGETPDPKHQRHDNLL